MSGQTSRRLKALPMAIYCTSLWTNTTRPVTPRIPNLARHITYQPVRQKIRKNWQAKVWRKSSTWVHQHPSCAQGVPLAVARMFSKNRPVWIGATYSSIIPWKFHENSPNLVCNWRRMSATRRRRDQRIWSTGSRENRRRVRADLKALDSPPYGNLLHKSMDKHNKASYSQNTKSCPAYYIPTCQAKN